ncbi:hypothetical protein HK100_010602 [Physocladia obscura]|uniref:Glycoside hydrolase family 43 protein n=1 Tax=Physocladia obscura TaxID=109957 RepID=A0AAD5XEM4_9FUNG|nr:hypothetical protein HK100_010602 [Physocladia obscura]
MKLTLVTLLAASAVQAISWQQGNNGAVLWSNDCDWSGGDIAAIATTGEDCATQCLATVGCVKFSWRSGTCWVKNYSAGSAFVSSGEMCGFTFGAYNQAIAQDFADPSIMLDSGGTWYAVATSGNGKTVQQASSQDFYHWTIINDALPAVGAWVDPTNTGIWAPEVRQLGQGSYVMYYTGKLPGQNSHCIGTATASTPAGPYNPAPNPLICNVAQGGVIDPSGFEDVTGARYILYKIDGNNVGNGGVCGNTVAPIHSTPIMLQAVGNDGVTLIGNPIQLIDRGAADGPLIEAPSLVYWDGWYYLFFSSNCYSTPQYDISYAVATSVTGPYTKVGAPNAPLLITGDYNLSSPGGATAINVLSMFAYKKYNLSFLSKVDDEYVNFVFHANLNGQNINNGRAMYATANICLNNGVVTLNCAM